jgi:hypothetical protein
MELRGVAASGIANRLGEITELVVGQRGDPFGGVA